MYYLIWFGVKRSAGNRKFLLPKDFQICTMRKDSPSLPLSQLKRQ
jgi:hypothetical protein